MIIFFSKLESQEFINETSNIVPSYRRLGIASKMIEHMMNYIARSRDLIVTTFCENDENSDT